MVSLCFVFAVVLGSAIPSAPITGEKTEVSSGVIEKISTDIVVSGSGVELFHPQFTYHGFRYVKITGYPGELKKSNFYAVTPDNKVNMVSFNHYSFGCVGEFIYEEIAGVKPLAPGFLKTLIAPDFRFGLASLSLSYETPGGSLTVAWETKNDEIHLEVVVPFNMEAVLKLNENFITTLEPGKYYYTIDEERKYV